MKARGLDQLKMLREQMRQEQELQAARVAAAAAQALREQQERDVFAKAVGPVQSLRNYGRAHVERARPSPHPHQRERDEREAMREALSDEVDVESLLLTDDGLSFRRVGIGPDVPTRRTGKMTVAERGPRCGPDTRRRG